MENGVWRDEVEERYQYQYHMNHMILNEKKGTFAFFGQI